MSQSASAPHLRAVSSEVPLGVVPQDRYGFKFIGTHKIFQETWNGSFAELSLGAATAVKLEDVIRGYEGFPVANVNIIPGVEARLNDVPEPWLGKVVYVIGTTLAPAGGEEHVISFCITNKADGSGRELTKSPRSITKGAEENSRVLLFRE